MKRRVAGAAMFILALLGAAEAGAKSGDAKPYKGPIIDVHLHAFPADGNGPAPNAICIGAAAMLEYDPVTPWPAKMGSLMTGEHCDDPLIGPATDTEVRDQTIAAMEKYDIRGVLSGNADRIAEWRAAAPGRFIPGREFSLERDEASAEQIEAEFLSGDFAVLAEVTNQYRGVLAGDPAFDDYWAVAAEHDIPVGIHLGVGPPGAPMLYPDFRVQSPLEIEDVLNRHPTLRVYLMHAGFPFADDLKAMLYLYPQLYVDTGVLQIAATREDYYAFLEEIVRAGFADRIMFGSDQMNWPGMIAEGIDAINDAPFLTYEQKKDILHDNAVRFLRLEE